MEDILAVWQTAWNLIRRQITRHLVWFQAVCKGLTIMISRLKVKSYGRRITSSYSKLSTYMFHLRIYTPCILDGLLSVVLFRCLSMLEIMHGGALEVIVHQWKPEKLPYDHYYVGVANKTNFKQTLFPTCSNFQNVHFFQQSEHSRFF